MTNKEAINNLNFIKDYYKDLDDYTINQLRNLTLSLSSVEIKALDKAIKSLEAWDKINEELEKEMNEYENVYTDLDYSTGVGYAIAVIEEHLKGVENE